MIDVSNHICALLYEYDYVNLPGFGAFIANYSPAASNEFSGSFMPPQKRVSFNEILKQDDGLLVLSLSKKEGISLDEASKLVKNYVENITKKLEMGLQFSIKKVGNFGLGKEGKLSFEPAVTTNFYGDSFGLELVYPKRYDSVFESKIEEELAYIFKPQKKSSSDKYFKFLTANIPFILFGAILTFIVLKNDSKTSFSSMNPFSSVSSIFGSKKSPKVKINNSIKRFKVITPNFSTIQDANAVKLALMEDGFKNSQVLLQEEKIYVNVEVFFNESEALKFQDRLFQTYKQEFHIVEQ